MPEASLDYIVSFGLPWATNETLSKKNFNLKKRKKEKKKK